MIEFKDVTKIYKRNDMETIALDQVNLQINKGEIFGIIGFSGAGKSTLIRVANYLEKPTSGTVMIEGESLGEYSLPQLRAKRKNIGMIFQHFNLLNSKTIYQNVAMPLILAKENKLFIRERVMELLDFVGLKNKAKSYPSELSGGQKQRIGIARALATNPSILLCDEATSALDPQTTDSILQLLKRINDKYHITIMVITHEMSIIQKICHRVAVMENGKIIEQGNVIDVFSHPEQLTTKNFVRTVLQDGFPDHLRAGLKHLDNSQLVTVTFGDQTNDVVNQIIRDLNINVNIVYSSLNEIKEQTVGTMTIQLVGDEHLRKDAIRKIISAGVYVKELVH